MFIAMNRFKVKKGSEHDFEQVWLSRETHLEDVPGFIEFPSPQRPRAGRLRSLCLTLDMALGGELPRLDAI